MMPIFFVNSHKFFSIRTIAKKIKEMNKMFKILEIVWLVMACVGVFMCAYCITIKDNKGSIYFLAFFVVCAVMYMVRRKQRIKYNQNQSSSNSGQQSAK